MTSLINNKIKKIFQIGVIVFLLIIPIANASDMSKNSSPATKTNIQHKNVADIPPFHWGPILYKSVDFYPDEYVFVSYLGTYWGYGLDLHYEVIGLGRHHIYFEMEYDLYKVNVWNVSEIIHKSGTHTGRDIIYTWSFLARPHIRLRTNRFYGPSHDLLINATVTGRFYIDEELIYTEKYYVDHDNPFSGG